MSLEKLNIIQLDNDLYERSYKLGELYTKAIKKSCLEMRKLLDKQTIRETLDIVKEKLEITYPKYLQEVYGRADGAKADRLEYLLYLCYEIYTERESCTDVMVKLEDGTIIGGHNEDGYYSLESTGLVKYNTDYGFLCEYFCTDALPGSTFCWNSHGMIFTCNYVYVVHKNSCGMPTWFILRDLVDCKTIDEVLQNLNILDAAGGCSLNIIDTKINKAVNVEWRLNNLSVKELDDKLVHSNHFTRKEVGLPIVVKTSNSKFRFDQVNELLEHRVVKSEKDILDILQYYTDNSNFSVLDTTFDDGHVTAATFIYNSKTKKFIIHSYLDKQVYNVDFDMNNLL